ARRRDHDRRRRRVRVHDARPDAGAGRGHDHHHRGRGQRPSARRRRLPVGTARARLMTRKTRRSQRGISLLEVLVAITLFALTSSGLAAFLVQSLRRTAGNRASTGAVIAAQHEGEDPRPLHYPAIVSRSYSTTITGKSYGVGTVVQNDAPASG